MAKTEAEKADVARANVPPYAAVVEAAQAYMADAGMELHDLALEIGYGKSSLRHLFRGTYSQVASTDTYICHALTDYMEQHPLPGEDGGLPKRLLQTRDTRLIMERIDQARE